jgi:hypothetical protein
MPEDYLILAAYIMWNARTPNGYNSNTFVEGETSG